MCAPNVSAKLTEGGGTSDLWLAMKFTHIQVLNSFRSFGPFLYLVKAVITNYFKNNFTVM